VAARAAHRQHHVVAGMEVVHGRAYFEHAPTHLVADDKLVAAWRRIGAPAVNLLTVRPADAHFEHLHEDIRGMRDGWLGTFDAKGALLSGMDGNRVHETSEA
jgi:hypothetical protein